MEDQINYYPEYLRIDEYPESDIPVDLGGLKQKPKTREQAIKEYLDNGGSMLGLRCAEMMYAHNCWVEIFEKCKMTGNYGKKNRRGIRFRR